MNSDQIEITVRTAYIEEQSQPPSRYAFAYHITISNHGAETCQLRHRHWVITNGRGEVEEVRGPGVVGEQPFIAPGESFSYTSGSVMETPVGTMEGHYDFTRADGSAMTVPIPLFSLRVAQMVH